MDLYFLGASFIFQWCTLLLTVGESHKSNCQLASGIKKINCFTEKDQQSWEKRIRRINYTLNLQSVFNVMSEV